MLFIAPNFSSGIILHFICSTWFSVFADYHSFTNNGSAVDDWVNAVCTLTRHTLVRCLVWLQEEEVGASLEASSCHVAVWVVGDGSSGDSTTAPFPAPETVLQDHGFSWTAGPTVRMELEGQSHELSASYREDGYAHYVSDKSILISVYFFF